MYKYSIWLSSFLIVLLISGCSLGSADKKPEIGPTGLGSLTLPNPPFLQRFQSPPATLYDLDALAGQLYEASNQNNSQQEMQLVTEMTNLWTETEPQVGEKKGVSEAKTALKKLQESVPAASLGTKVDNLNQFMGKISEIGQSYKLSPLADLISTSNNVRILAYYVGEKDWSKASAKVQQLEGNWEQIKPGLEKFGVLSEITATHGTIKSLRDSVSAEDKDGSEGKIKQLNDHLGKIRDYYRSK